MLKIVGGLVVALIVCSVNWGLDWNLYDLLYKRKGKRAPNQDIVLVTIDDKTLKELANLWPLPMNVYSDFLKTVCGEKPSVIGFDIEFDYEAGSSGEYRKMADVIRDTGCRTVWGRSFYEKGNELKPVPAELPYSDESVFTTLTTEGKSAKGYEQYVRRAAPHWHNGFDLLKSLAFKVSEIHSGKSADDYRYYLFWVDYSGPSGTYATFSMFDILKGNYSKGFFKDKIVLVGRGEADNFSNYFRTPYYNGNRIVDTLRVEIHANIADTILSSRKIFIADKYLSYTITVFLSIFTVFVLFGTTPLTGIIIVFGQMIILLFSGLLTLKMQQYVSMVEPLFGVFISYYLLIPYRLVKEYRSRWEYQQANRILSEVERMKSNFLSLITHDLKTPIARIQGQTESLLRDFGKKLDDTQKKHLKSIMSNSEELNNFISRIIKLAQVEASKVKLNLTSRDINALIEETAQKFEYVFKDAGIELEKNLEPIFSTKMDVQLINQVLHNLIDNAIKYSGSGTKIIIRSWEQGGFVRVSVKDEGIGIKEEDLKRMFTKFYRIKDERVSDIKGSGLGLYLVKYFVELHGGNISVESEPNKGSTFTFSLPIA